VSANKIWVALVRRTPRVRYLAVDDCKEAGVRWSGRSGGRPVARLDGVSH